MRSASIPTLLKAVRRHCLFFKSLVLFTTGEGENHILTLLSKQPFFSRSGRRKQVIISVSDFNLRDWVRDPYALRLSESGMPGILLLFHSPPRGKLLKKDKPPYNWIFSCISEQLRRIAWRECKLDFLVDKSRTGLHIYLSIFQT